MAIIKPGKIRVAVDQKQAERRLREEAWTEKHEIWDDFSSGKKGGKKKKEYERGTGNRMVQKVEDKRGETSQEAMPDANGEWDGHKARVDFEALEERLGYSFVNRELLLRAVTHRSALGAKERVDYERLEFLGDAVLDLSVAHLLSDRYPEAREGELSKMRAALVNTHALAHIARALDVGPFIKLGRGELSSGGYDRPSILADVMEALVGAMYHDSNYDTAMKVIEKIFGDELEQVTPYDPKTELQEVLHAAGSEPPNYLLELVEGPEHAPTFVTVVVVDGEIAGRGRGSTKKAAQQVAAAEALEKMFPMALPVQLVSGQREIIEAALLQISEQALNPKNARKPYEEGLTQETERFSLS